MGGSVVNGSVQPAIASSNMFDIGILGRYPLLKLREESGILPEFEFAGAASMNNIGGYVTYLGVAHKDPLPRAARMGVGLRIGLGSVNPDAETFGMYRWN